MDYINKNELLDLIKENYIKIKPKICSEFFKLRDKKIPCLPTLQKLFEMTYNEILIKAGIPDTDLNFVRRDQEQYLEKLKEITEEIGYVPSVNQFIKLGYSPSILAKYFGTYENAAKIIDSEYKYKKRFEKVNESKEELLDRYIEYSKKIGKPASYNDILCSGELPSVGVYKHRFGRMEFLKKEAGYESEKPCNLKYEKKDVMKNLIALYLNKGRRLTVKELAQESSIPSYSTILYNFKTTKISKVWEEIEGYISKMNINSVS